VYPAKELKELAARRQWALDRIALRRQQCAQAGLEIAATVAKVEGWYRVARHWADVATLVLPILKFRPSKVKGAVRGGIGPLSLVRWGLAGWRYYRMFKRVAGGRNRLFVPAVPDDVPDDVDSEDKG
jgi:hypothetical protein